MGQTTWGWHKAVDAVWCATLLGSGWFIELLFWFWISTFVTLRSSERKSSEWHNVTLRYTSCIFSSYVMNSNLTVFCLFFSGKGTFPLVEVKLLTRTLKLVSVYISASLWMCEDVLLLWYLDVDSEISCGCSVQFRLYNWFFMTPSIATKFQYVNSLLFSFPLTTCFGPYGPS
jgi:hypothetical protein